MASRGGAQRIPRPSNAIPGPAPSWADLPADQLHFDLATVRSKLARPRQLKSIERGAQSRDAAVLVALFDRDDEARVVLTKRPETMPSHQGEIAFPGGKHDAIFDTSLSATALREAQEEVGLNPAEVEIVAELQTLSTVASQFSITPFVGLVAVEPQLVAHPREVVRVFDVALGELLAAETHRSEIWPLPSGAELTIHFYELPGETVWGATARILTHLLESLTAPLG